MKQTHHLSPHNTRVFSALLWTLGVSVLTVNYLTGFQQITTDTPTVNQLISNPFSPQAHLLIAEEFLPQKKSTVAQNEILLIKDLLHSRDPQVLGAATSVQNTLSLWEAKPVQLKKMLSFWEQIIKEKPDYKDAYIQSAIAAWKLGNYSKATDLLEKIKTFDPDFSERMFQIQ